MDDKKQRAWSVPTALAPAIERVLPALAAEILEAIASEVPEYARPLEGSFGRGIRVGVDEALKQFVELIRNPSLGREGGREVYVALGRGEFNEGRSLNALQAAYRVGARVAWRRMGSAAAAAGRSPAEVYELADAIFAYIDEISADSVEGYADAQSAREGEREMRRARLVTAVVASSSATEIDRLAALSGWRRPERVAIAACSPDETGPTARRLSADTLYATVDDVGCLVLTDPEGPETTARLADVPATCSLTVGPAVSLDEAATSWREARAAHAARTAGLLGTEGGLMRTEEHLAGLMLAENRERLDRLRDRQLAPLETETEASARRLRETLAAWIRNMAAVSETAAELHVHPQTVRYRMARVRELLGDRLDDPEARFEIQLALRGRRD